MMKIITRIGHIVQQLSISHSFLLVDVVCFVFFCLFWCMSLSSETHNGNNLCCLAFILIIKERVACQDMNAKRDKHAKPWTGTEGVLLYKSFLSHFSRYCRLFLCFYDSVGLSVCFINHMLLQLKWLHRDEQTEKLDFIRQNRCWKSFPLGS